MQGSLFKLERSYNVMIGWPGGADMTQVYQTMLQRFLDWLMSGLAYEDTSADVMISNLAD
jgi:hypothetical protein